MEKTYRLKSREISMTFLKSLKMMFGGQEVEITVRSIEQESSDVSKRKKGLLEMIKENRKTAPLILEKIDIRELIDESQNPA